MLEKEIDMKRSLILFALFSCFAYAQESTTNLNYRGQPPAAPMAPSISSFSQDNCLVAVSGAVSSTVIGFLADLT